MNADTLDLARTLISAAVVITTTVTAYLMARLNKKQDAVVSGQVDAAVEVKAAAVKVEEVKQVLHRAAADDQGRFAELLIVATDTHKLVNSQMGAALTISALALRRVADLQQGKPGHDADVRAAEAAEAALAEHNARQAVADAAKKDPT